MCGDLTGGTLKLERYSHFNSVRKPHHSAVPCPWHQVASSSLRPLIIVAPSGRRMAAEDSELVTATQPPGQRQGQVQGQAQSLPSYCLNLSQIVQLAQMKELQGVVQRQFGVHGDSPVRLCA